MDDTEKVSEWLRRNRPERLPGASAEGADYLERWSEHRRFGLGPAGGSELRRRKAGASKRRPDPAAPFLRGR